MTQERIIDSTIERVQRFLAAWDTLLGVDPEVIYSVVVDPIPLVAHNLTVSDLKALCEHATPPKPRVFFDGDTIPAGVRVMDDTGDIHPAPTDDPDEWISYLGPVVEVLLDHGTEVARARQEKAHA